jgi:hypothetical protein
VMERESHNARSEKHRDGDGNEEWKVAPPGCLILRGKRWLRVGRFGAHPRPRDCLLVSVERERRPERPQVGVGILRSLLGARERRGTADGRYAGHHQRDRDEAKKTPRQRIVEGVPFSTRAQRRSTPLPQTNTDDKPQEMPLQTAFSDSCSAAARWVAHHSLVLSFTSPTRS